MWDALREFLGGVVSFFYDLIPNLGIAIILLTIAVGAVLFPLTLKQTRSMKAMQEIQPEVKRLQKEYKGDKPVLQQKTMELYREKGINPAAGCLPILLQMPIWFALFQVLRSFGDRVGSSADPTRFVPGGSRLAEAIREGDTGFLGMNLAETPGQIYSNDGLLTALPYLITIALVMVTAYWQQKQTMARADKTNPNAEKPPGQAILKIFPYFFGFISFSMPTGLVVYFAASQLFRIGQQAVILGLDEKEKPETTVVEANDSPPPEPEVEEPPTPRSPAPDSTNRPQGQRRPQGAQRQRGKKRRRK